VELNEVNLEKLMEADVAMRDKIAELETEIKDIKVKREKIQFALNEICKEMNVSSLKTKIGTLTRSIKTRYWAGDWPAMYEFMKEHNALDLMEKRIAQGNMKEFLEQNPDVVPPSLQQNSEFSIVIRRSRETEE